MLSGSTTGNAESRLGFEPCGDYTEHAKHTLREPVCYSPRRPHIAFVSILRIA